ncbi:hypothetical protein DERP_010310 [Dermatophagoides pteronyssinus]|uniref:Uncharacterized protein n=1 Tax=Dermatophagoides pteronyssinus TaxID=6956 RepID=A0ABQ8IYR2_DERPT|nr:hypothetical protein DERP_010310 [Dermatophagoides pteronyssinus]
MKEIQMNYGCRIRVDTRNNENHHNNNNNNRWKAVIKLRIKFLRIDRIVVVSMDSLFIILIIIE